MTIKSVQLILQD